MSGPAERQLFSEADVQRQILVRVKCPVDGPLRAEYWPAVIGQTYRSSQTALGKIIVVAV